MDIQSATEVQFRKSKKRKREKATYNDEIPQERDILGEKSAKKDRKRKKDAKRKEKTSENTNTSINEDDSKKESNEKTATSKELSKRKLKKQKIEDREIEQRNISRMNTIQKALNYVSKWKHSRSEWKFEKIKQIWLIDNLLDGNSIPDTIFPTVLEYFEGCKGMAREILFKKGMDVIKKAEQENEENRDKIVESVTYKRARQLLQALPIEA